MQQTVVKTELVIRRSVAALIVKIVVFEVTLLLLYTFARLAIFWVLKPLNVEVIVNPLLFFKSLIFAVLELSLLLYLLTDWLVNYYIIRKSEIVFVSGLLRSSRKDYNIANLQSIYYHQSLLGRIFNFGDIVIFSPALQRDLVMHEVPNPRDMVDNIKTASKAHDSNITFLLRR